MKTTTRIICAVGVICGLFLLTGCATYKVNEDGSVTTYGFFRNLAVKNTYYESGALQSADIKTESTTRDIMSGANEMIDTAANTCAKIKL